MFDRDPVWDDVSRSDRLTGKDYAIGDCESLAGIPGAVAQREVFGATDTRPRSTQVLRRTSGHAVPAGPSAGSLPTRVRPSMLPIQASPSVHVLPDVTAAGDVQMAIDEHLLATAGAGTLMRRYFWEPPALSLGASQAPPRRLEDASNPPDVPFDIVRRPSGGRAVLHGSLWEWSFAVVVPGTRGVDAAYGMVSAAAEAAFRHAGIALSGRQDVPYRRSALCFATSLRHDLHCAGGKVVAIAQTQRQGAALVHGSVLERRPPADLLACLEDLVEEPWCGDGYLAHGGVSRDDLWGHFTESMVRIVEHDPGHDREA